MTDPENEKKKVPVRCTFKALRKTYLSYIKEATGIISKALLWSAAIIPALIVEYLIIIAGYGSFVAPFLNFATTQTAKTTYGIDLAVFVGLVLCYGAYIAVLCLYGSVSALFYVYNESRILNVLRNIDDAITVSIFNEEIPTDRVAYDWNWMTSQVMELGEVHTIFLIEMPKVLIVGSARFGINLVLAGSFLLFALNRFMPTGADAASIAGFAICSAAVIVTMIIAVAVDPIVKCLCINLNFNLDELV